MTVSENIIIGDSIAHKAEEIVEAVRLGKSASPLFWYGITSAPEKENLMYIASSIELNRPCYRSDSYALWALAGSRKEALAIVLELVEKGYTTGNIHHMKDYLEMIL